MFPSELKMNRVLCLKIRLFYFSFESQNVAGSGKKPHSDE